MKLRKRLRKFFWIILKKRQLTRKVIKHRMEREKNIQIDPDAHENKKANHMEKEWKKREEKVKSNYWWSPEIDTIEDGVCEPEMRRRRALEQADYGRKYLLAANTWLAMDGDWLDYENGLYAQRIRTYVAMVLENIEHISFELENQHVSKS